MLHSEFRGQDRVAGPEGWVCGFLLNPSPRIRKFSLAP